MDSHSHKRAGKPVAPQTLADAINAMPHAWTGEPTQLQSGDTRTDLDAAFQTLDKLPPVLPNASAMEQIDFGDFLPETESPSATSCVSKDCPSFPLMTPHSEEPGHAHEVTPCAMAEVQFEVQHHIPIHEPPDPPQELRTPLAPSEPVLEPDDEEFDFSAGLRDFLPPTSQVEPLPSVIESEEFLVRWNGQDNTGRAGLAYFDLFVSVDGGPFEPWLEQTNDNEAMFNGLYDHTYGFACAATDNNGNRESMPSEPDALTTLREPIPAALPEIDAPGEPLPEALPDEDFDPEAVIPFAEGIAEEADALPEAASAAPHVCAPLAELASTGETFAEEEAPPAQEVLPEVAAEINAEAESSTEPLAEYALPREPTAEEIPAPVVGAPAPPPRPAPRLDPTRVGKLPPVVPGQLSAGSVVEEILGAGIEEKAPAARIGLAVVGLTGTLGGTWQYSLDEGSTWNEFGPVYHGKARLLRACDRIRFVANLGFLGDASLTFRAWDEYCGAAGETANLCRASSVGEGTRFSRNTATTSVYVTQDTIEPEVHYLLTPLVSNRPGGEPISRLLGVSYLEIDEADATGIAVVALSGATAGIWQYSLDGGRSWKNFGAVYRGRARLLRATDRIRFIPHGAHPVRAAITYHGWNQKRGRPGETINLASPGALGEASGLSEATQTAQWAG